MPPVFRLAFALGGKGGLPLAAFGGAGGVSDDFGLASAWAHQRTLRLADGPDEVHARAIARIEFARHAPKPGNDAAAFSSGDVGAAR